MRPTTSAFHNHRQHYWQYEDEMRIAYPFLLFASALLIVATAAVYIATV